MNLLPQQLKQFKSDGYLIFDTQIPNSTLDKVNQHLAPYWGKDGLKLEGVPYADFNRIQDAWQVDAAVKSIATFPHILALLQALYGRKPLPFQTTNFYRGTEQKVHADSIHFNSEPFGLVCGVWVALEDVSLEQGPVVYYPGSQHLPELNFEDMDLEPNYIHYPLYEAYIERLVEEQHLKPAYAVMQKGQALVWAANLLHGSAKQTNPLLTRQSQVTHYYFQGAKPWHPGFSTKASASYFEPNFIPYAAAERTLTERLLAWFKR
jgi:hypothetical protein